MWKNLKSHKKKKITFRTIRSKISGRKRQRKFCESIKNKGHITFKGATLKTKS